jgi:uncharacterized protein HemX
MKLPPFPNPSWLSRLGLALTSVLAVVAGLAVASVLFAVLLVAGLAAGSWLWWQYRKLARRARDTRPDFLEGEYAIEPEHPALEDRRADPAKPAEERVRPEARRAP